MAGAFESKGEEKLGILADAAAAFQAGLSDASELVGQLLKRDVQKGFSEGPQSGRLYSRLPRQSSAAGEYPAIQFGELNNSIDYEVHGSHSLDFGSRGAFNDDFDYALNLHEGTPGGQLAARPYLTMTVERTRDEVIRLLGEVTYRKIIGGG